MKPAKANIPSSLCFGVRGAERVIVQGKEGEERKENALIQEYTRNNDLERRYNT